MNRALTGYQLMLFFSVMLLIDIVATRDIFLIERTITTGLVLVTLAVLCGSTVEITRRVK